MFIKDGKICFIETDKHEPKQYYLERGNFVVSQKINSIEDYEKIVTYSRIMINVKYMGATYDKTIMKELNNLLNNCYCE